jgi:hypothetical protein
MPEKRNLVLTKDGPTKYVAQPRLRQMNDFCKACIRVLCLLSTEVLTHHLVDGEIAMAEPT